MNMSERQDSGRWGKRVALVIILATLVVAVLAFGVTALLVNIFERKQEARNPFYRVVELTDMTSDPAIWGKNFPMQYDGYRRTVDMVRTKFGGSEAMPRTPDEVDSRSVVAQSRLEADPRLRTMWAGYAFAKDFREERGHAYMLEDQVFTERQRVVQQPGTCIHCHASTYVPYKLAGNGDMMKGFEHFNKIHYGEAKKEMEQIMKQHGDQLHPVACIDCHDPKDMQLRVTRPGFILGINALAESGAPVPALPSIQRWRDGNRQKPYDPNVDASRQEMRSYVCGQCHVEYYFKGPGKLLTYPWHKGLRADQILDYYQEVGFKDWTHAETGAPVLKAQHPEFETWNQGIHARSGVACADCHMPYKREGAMKISDHHVRSPLLNINNACQTCHKFTEVELKERSEKIQQTTYELRNTAMDALMDLIADLKAAKTAGTSDEQLAKARDFQRQAQFLLDFIEAENSMGFHASQEAARNLTLSIDRTRKGQQALRGLPGITAALATSGAPAVGDPATTATLATPASVDGPTSR